MTNNKSRNTKKTPKTGKEVGLTLKQVQELLEAHEEGDPTWRIFKIMTEFVSGFDFLKQFDKAASIFGSARFKTSSPYYKEVVKLTKRLSKAGFTIITGGGPGVMEAANKGAFDADGRSVGLNIKLPAEQRTNKYVKESQAFYYFFVRKVMLAFASEIYIFFPGGFGTLDEFSELVTLVQTKKIHPVPIVLIGKKFWTPLLTWIETTMVKEYGTIDAKDQKIYHLVDDADEAWEYIQGLITHHKLQRSDIQKDA